MPRKSDTPDTVTLRVAQADGTITATRPGVDVATYEVVDHQIVVALDDPHLPALRGLDPGSIEPDTGVAGTVTTPEAPAAPKEA